MWSLQSSRTVACELRPCVHVCMCVCVLASVGLPCPVSAHMNTRYKPHPTHSTVLLVHVTRLLSSDYLSAQ